MAKSTHNEMVDLIKVYHFSFLNGIIHYFLSSSIPFLTDASLVRKANCGGIVKEILY
jgi:hypothetical protein